MKVSSIIAFIALMVSIHSQTIERGYLSIDDVKLVILKEMDSMQKHNDFFEAFNTFARTCENKIVPMLITLGLEPEENLFFCKLIENAIPDYFMPVFTVNAALNDGLVETIIKEFFKIYSELAFDLERIKIAKVFRDNISILYRVRNIFPFDADYFSGLMKGIYVREEAYEINEKNLERASRDFIDFMSYKFMDKSASLLYSNPRLYMFTFYQMFEEPFEAISYMLNDISLSEQSFIVKHGERRLYLLDNLDNMALKSLNIFKTKRTNEIIDATAKEQQNKFEYEDKHIKIPNAESLEDYISKDQYTPKEDEVSEMNFRLINVCVKSTAFSSQSMEKIFCYFITAGVRNVGYLIENDKYNFRLQEIFRKISEENEGAFIKYKPSYITEESEYNKKIYPKFKQSLSNSAVAFRTELKKLERDFYDNYLKAIRQNFMYHWRKIVAYFLSQAVFRPGISQATLEKNILNFFQFTQDNWVERRESDYFKFNEFYQHFLTTYHENLQKFTQFK